MRRLAAVTFALATLGLAGQALAQSTTEPPGGGRLAVGVQVGTVGVGAEAQLWINRYVTLRGGIDGFRFDEDVSSDNVDYDGRARWLTGSTFVDVHPFGNGVMVTGGGYFGKQRKIDVTARANQNIVINGTSFTPAQIGRIDGEVEFDKATPFVGLGYDSTFRSEARWGFKILAGAAFSGSPDTTLVASGGQFSNDPVVQGYLREEEREINADADDFKTWPVVQLGVNYRF